MEMSILKEVSNGIIYLTLNRPETLNAFTTQMFLDLAFLVDECNHDQSIHTIVLTGNGTFFTSGNDQKNLLAWIGKAEKESKEGINSFVSNIDTLCESLINNQKPFIIGINGPAIGIGVTILAHADYVIASESAYFLAPFSMIGICPEMCSSYTFSKMIGTIGGKKILMFGQKMSAKEVLKIGLVSRLIKMEELKDGKDSFQRRLKRIVNELLNPLSDQAIKSTKKLMMGRGEKEKLHSVRVQERELLREKLSSSDVQTYAMKILAKK